MTARIRFHAQYLLMGDTYGVLAAREDWQGHMVEIAKAVEWEPRVEDVLIDRPTFSLDREAVQSLMDELWRLGVRPKEQGSAGQLEATERHLADMRRIVFDKLGVEEPTK